MAGLENLLKIVSPIRPQELYTPLSARGVPVQYDNGWWTPSLDDRIREAIRQNSGVLNYKRGGLAQMAGGGLVRRALQQTAKTYGIPANQSTAKLQSLSDILAKTPSTWSMDELRSVAPYLSVHQDIRPGAADRVQSIMSQGLNHGMVDNLDNLAFGNGWSWGRQFQDGVAYVLPSGNLKYRSATSPWLSEGNMPMFYMPTTKGMSIEELIKGALTP